MMYFFVHVKYYPVIKKIQMVHKYILVNAQYQFKNFESVMLWLARHSMKNCKTLRICLKS